MIFSDFAAERAADQTGGGVDIALDEGRVGLQLVGELRREGVELSFFHGELALG